MRCDTTFELLPENADLLDMLSRPAPALDFVLPGLVCGTVGSLIGPGGVGKSFFCLSAAASVAIPGLDLLGLGIKAHGDVLVISTEDAADVLHARMEALAAQLTPAQRREIHRVHWKNCSNLSIDIMATQWLEALARAGQGKRLIILDTLRQIHGLDENSAHQMAALVRQLKQLAQVTGAAVLFLHHTSKSADTSGHGADMHAGRGSSVLFSDSRGQANLSAMTPTQARAFGKDEADCARYVQWSTSKNNYGPAESRWYVRGVGGVLVPADLDISKKATSSARPDTKVIIGTAPKMCVGEDSSAGEVKAAPQIAQKPKTNGVTHDLAKFF